MAWHKTVLPHLTPYFLNWPVRIWPICRSEGAMGTYSPRFRGQWPYHIRPWPLCSLWWGEDWPGGAPGTDPPKIGVLECASSRISAQSRTGELGTFLLRTNHLRGLGSRSGGPRRADSLRSGICSSATGRQPSSPRSGALGGGRRGGNAPAPAMFSDLRGRGGRDST
jgi:hypothetical protein